MISLANCLFPGEVKGYEHMIDDNYSTVKTDFIIALRIIYRGGLNDPFAHLSIRSNDSDEMLFMPRKNPAVVQNEELFFLESDKPVPQSDLHV